MNERAVLRRRLGWLLLWALLPLPFLYIVLPPFWMTAVAAAVWLVLWPDRVPAPSRLLLNLVAILILVVVVMTGGLNVGPLRPLGHLLLLLTSVRVVLVDDRTGFMRSLALVGMVWIVSVASSTHMAAAGYFLASAAIGWWLGIRLHLDSLGLPGEDRNGPLPRPVHVVVAVVLALAVAVPFFLVMPRLGSPWVAGRSFGRSTGFSPDVDLGKLGRLTQNQEVALTMRSAVGDDIREDWTRLRGTAFDQVMAGSFVPRRTDLRQLEPSRGVVWLRQEAEPLEDLVEIEVDLLRPRRYLMLPPGSVAVQAATPMALDLYGGVLIGYRRGRPLSYRIWVGEPRPPEMSPPTTRDVLLPRDHPEVRQLARTVAGDLPSAQARAAAVERFLQTEYRYSLESGVRISDSDPVAWFLLEGREGHCEFFAGAMVVMLRHLGVPARMVAGYSGGDLSPERDELVVREANAHAWVEVWLGESQGWVTFDPTPPVGVPGLGSVGGMERVRWAWQQLELLWDQKLLTFGLGEQLDLIETAGEWLRAGRDAARRRAVQLGAAASVVGLAAVMLVVLWWARRVRPWRAGRRRGSGPASRAVGRLARSLVPVGGVVPPSATVRRIGGQAAVFWPASAAAVAELVDRAEAELYGAGGDDDPAEIRLLWQRIRAGMKHREMRVGG
ncbi:MAG: transglutaminaseTgpA domain-containing protein [Thermoanaerobaculales bacterium]|nr:transglutaminaseTgpA domain-containing protein [Thermoanaerobaculales bacterium]